MPRRLFRAEAMRVNTPSIGSSGAKRASIWTRTCPPIQLEEALLLSTAMAGTSTFEIDTGPAYAFKDYIIMTSVTGTYPGFTMNGLHIPLNLDALTWIVFSLVGTPVLVNFMGSLDILRQIESPEVRAFVRTNEPHLDVW